MPSANVTVKWGREKFDVEADLDEAPLTFKAQLFALSGVEPTRMRVMLKGKTLGDLSWADFPVVKDGVTLMMMGSAEKIPEAPKNKTVFLEDMTEAQLASALEIPTGLKNLGNTCYMNATLQCLKTVPELRDSLKSFQGNIAAAMNGLGGAQSGGPTAISGAVRDLYDSMDRSTGRDQKEVIPLVMLQVLHMVFPQFNTKDDHGHPQQQDANECWVEMVRMFQQALPGKSTDQQAAAGTAGVSAAKKLITQYFGGEMSVTMKCTESEEEPPVESTEEFLQLGCYLSQEVKYLHSGLQAKLVEEITKNSPTLGRNAVYEKRSLLSRLPKYLAIQMIRFEFKGAQGVNAKILKEVKFPLMLDVFELCSDNLKQKLMPMRDRFKQEDDRVADLAGKDEDPNAKKKFFPTEFEEDPGSNNCGYYELQAVLTHKGRSSNSGHYVGWVKRKDNVWFVCDDESVKPVTTEEILKLCGGGDWHSAYVLLYGPRVLEVPETGTEKGEAKMEG